MAAAGSGDAFIAGIREELQLEVVPEGSGSFVLESVTPDPLPTCLELLNAQAQLDGHIWTRYRVAPEQIGADG